jgi:hypothetical protein
MLLFSIASGKRLDPSKHEVLTVLLLTREKTGKGPAL